MKKIIVVMIVVMAVCGIAKGETVRWFNLNNSTNWSTYGNWHHESTSPTWGAPPTAADYTLIGAHYGYGSTVVVDVPATTDQIQVGEQSNASLDVQNPFTAVSAMYVAVGAGASNVSLNMNSASGSISTPYLMLGHTGGKATMSVSAGSVSGNTLYVGYYGAGSSGQLNMSGGTMNLTSLHVATYDAAGNIALSGGTINANWFEIGASGSGIGTLTLSGSGKLVIGDAFESTTFWMNRFNAYNGTKILNAQANIVGNTVEITMIPEPATMGLLGLGGLVAIRRKR